jgi:hypothetical protein
MVEDVAGDTWQGGLLETLQESSDDAAESFVELSQLVVGTSGTSVFDERVGCSSCEDSRAVLSSVESWVLSDPFSSRMEDPLSSVIDDTLVCSSEGCEVLQS